MNREMSFKEEIHQKELLKLKVIHVINCKLTEANF